MNYDLLINKLKSWNIDEEFFRKYYFIKKNNESVEELLSTTDASEYDKNIALFPETISTDLSEKRFFSDKQNVVIIKHPRYCPLFLHKHSFFEINYVFSGQCKYIIQEHTIELSEGDLCICAPEVYHGLEVNDDSVILNILIRQSTFIDIFLHAIRNKSQLSMFFMGNLYEKTKIPYLLFHSEKDECLRNYILDMYCEQLQEDEYSDRIICSLMTIFFAQLTRRYGKKIIIPEEITINSKLGNEMLNYIMDHYNSVTLEELARHFHFSESYCSKMIKSITGSTFSDLLTRIRLKQGENFLSHTQLSVADISDKLGYKNPETFIRAFQRVYHISPSFYRKQINS